MRSVPGPDIQNNAAADADAGAAYLLCDGARFGTLYGYGRAGGFYLKRNFVGLIEIEIGDI